MRKIYKRVGFVAGMILFGAILFVVYLGPKHPVAIITVIDASGKPISDVVVTPYALRPKNVGGIGAGHFGWIGNRMGVEPNPVTTDKSGQASVNYPMYVVEQLETEKISIRLTHPKFVSSNPEVTVSTFPAKGAPLKSWLAHFLNRLKKKNLLSHPTPVVMNKGGIPILDSNEEHPPLKLFAQSTSNGSYSDDFWRRNPSGELVTYKHETGSHALRLIGLDDQGEVMFSDLVNVLVEMGKTNRIKVPLNKGFTLHGKLDATVQRPVIDGIVVVSVNPSSIQTSGHPLLWHSWAPIKEDGTFEIKSLPSGELEIVGLSQGFISKSKKGNGSLIYPQKHTIDKADLNVVLDMVRTAQLEVTVLDENEKPIEGVQVHTSPNVRWVNRFSTIFGGDCYHSLDRLLSAKKPKLVNRDVVQNGFAAYSNEAGLAVLPNVPVNMATFGVSHTNYVLPKLKTSFGAERRYGSIRLSPGTTNQISISLEPSGRSPIRHY